MQTQRSLIGCRTSTSFADEIIQPATAVCALSRAAASDSGALIPAFDVLSLEGRWRKALLTGGGVRGHDPIAAVCGGFGCSHIPFLTAVKNARSHSLSISLNLIALTGLETYPYRLSAPRKDMTNHDEQLVVYETG